MKKGHVELCGWIAGKSEGVRTVCNQVMSKNELVEAQRRPAREYLVSSFCPTGEAKDPLSGSNIKMERPLRLRMIVEFERLGKL